jgi:hypothetical protein
VAVWALKTGKSDSVLGARRPGDGDTMVRMLLRWIDRANPIIRTASFPIAAAVIFITSAIASAAATEISEIRAQLFYGYSGALSVDLIKEKSLALWNTPMGGGGIEEPATDLLVTVVLKGPERTFDPKARLMITVFDADKNSKVKEREFRGILYGDKGQAARAVFVPDRTCTQLRIVARTARGRMSETVPFHCGE